VVEKSMAEHYNKSSMKQRRKMLRNNLSKAEAIMWNYLSRRKMHGYKFRRQHSIDQYVLDFYCPELKLAIEIDGDSHFISGAEEYDKVRQEHIESFGVHFLRFTNMDVCENIDGVCQTIWEEIETVHSAHNNEGLKNSFGGSLCEKVERNY
jgi:very-short-patch-repair endonuclease